MDHHRERPPGPGVYVFTVQDDRELRVAYAGLTSHLWMVTKGRLPDGQGARGGQRYGRLRHAGATRQRGSVLIAEQVRAGHRVQHWVPLHVVVCRVLYAAVAYVRAAASRAGVPMRQACQDLDEPPAIWRCSADLVRVGTALPRAADQMQIRRFCVRWYTIVIAAD